VRRDSCSEPFRNPAAVSCQKYACVYADSYRAPRSSATATLLSVTTVFPAISILLRCVPQPVPLACAVCEVVLRFRGFVRRIPGVVLRLDFWIRFSRAFRPCTCLASPANTNSVSTVAACARSRSLRADQPVLADVAPAKTATSCAIPSARVPCDATGVPYPRIDAFMTSIVKLVEQNQSILQNVLLRTPAHAALAELDNSTPSWSGCTKSRCMDVRDG